MKKNDDGFDNEYSYSEEKEEEAVEETPVKKEVVPSKLRRLPSGQITNK